MDIETANAILKDKDNQYEMTGIEKALLAVIKDLQVRVAELTLKGEGIEK